MKTKLILLLTLFLCSYVPETEEKIADIIDNRQKGWPTEHTDGHKDKDVEIYAIGPFGLDSTHYSKETYALVTFKMKDNQLKYNLDFIIGYENVFDKVSYRWENDTILRYRLFNSSNSWSENMSLILHSNGSKTSISEPAN